MPKSKIPAGVTPNHFMDVRQMLLRVLKETGAKRVNMRLNESDREEPSPVFIGCVEDDDMARRRVAMNEPDTGLFRFGDKEHAVVYNECVSAGRQGRITERDWKSQLAEKSPNAKFLGPRLGAMHQKFVGITVDRGKGCRCVGTLTAGFFRRPGASVGTKARRVMRKWAQSPRSELVRYLQKHFLLGGPTFPR